MAKVLEGKRGGGRDDLCLEDMCTWLAESLRALIVCELEIHRSMEVSCSTVLSKKRLHMIHASWAISSPLYQVSS